MRPLACHLDGLGSVRGASERPPGAEGEVVAFRGVPYAAPPLGPRRFLPPQAPIPWQGLRDATRNGPIAPQPALRVAGTMGAIALAQDEDCLTLNIWTSAEAGQKAPVIVWIHGGGFISGAGSLPWYDGSHLVANALVTFSAPGTTDPILIEYGGAGSAAPDRGVIVEGRDRCVTQMFAALAGAEVGH